MMFKLSALVLAILVALWAAGVDFQSVRDSVTGASGDNARSMTGRHDDWG